MNRHEQEVLDSVESEINKTFDFLRKYGDVKEITRIPDDGEGFTYRIEKDDLWAILDISVSVVNDDDIVKFEYTYRDSDDRDSIIRKEKAFYPYGHTTDDWSYCLTIKDNCVNPYMNVWLDMERLYTDGKEDPHDREMFDYSLDHTVSNGRSFALAYFEIAKTVVESELSHAGWKPEIEEKLSHQWNGVPIHVSYKCGDWVVALYVTDILGARNIGFDAYFMEPGPKGVGGYYRLEGQPVSFAGIDGPFIDRFRSAFGSVVKEMR